ncbi:MAG: fibronectin type III domain-containing protein [Nitrospirota bacterium]
MPRPEGWGRRLLERVIRAHVVMIGVVVVLWSLGLAQEAAAQPAITLVNPGNVTYGVTSTSSITISGSGFQVGDQITVGSLNGTTVAGSTPTASVPFVFASSSTLRFYWANTSLPPGVYDVVVTNPSSGNTDTAVGAFTVSPPQPSIIVVNPASVTYGVTASRAITIDGTNFVVGATVTIGSLSGTTVSGSTATAGVHFVHVTASRVSVWWDTTALAPGAYTVSVTNPAAAGGLSVSQTAAFTVDAPQPSIIVVNPASVTYGVTTSRAITIDGTNFVLGATVTIGSLSGTTVSGSAATAGVHFVHVTASRVSVWWDTTALAPGAYAVTVTNPAAAGGLSVSLAAGFTVAEAGPTILLVNPSAVTYGVTPSRAITIDGTNFVLGATVTIGSLSGTTQAGSTATAGVPFVHVTANRLSFWWDNTDLAPGAYTVTVTNPAAAGGQSVSLTAGFTVDAAQPSIILVNPASVTYGVTLSRAISIDGTNFVLGATVQVTAPLPITTTLSGTTVSGGTATSGVPFVHVTTNRISMWWPNEALTPGAYTVTVTNPAAAGGLSGSSVGGFTVAPPVPTISSVSPSTVEYNVTASSIVTITGTNFFEPRGADLPSVSLDSTDFGPVQYSCATGTAGTASPSTPCVHVSRTTIEFYWSQTALPPGTYDLEVTNPAYAGAASNAPPASFVVTAPQPDIQSIRPGAVAAGFSSSRAVDVIGTDNPTTHLGFVAGAELRVDDPNNPAQSLLCLAQSGTVPTATTPCVYVGPGLLRFYWDTDRAAASVNPLLGPGSYSVTVTNPASRGSLTDTLPVGGFRVLANPELISVEPTTGVGAGARSAVLTLTTAGFPSGSVVRIGTPAPDHVQVQDSQVTMRSGFRAYDSEDGGTVVIDIAEDPAQATNRHLAVTITSPDGLYQFTCSPATPGADTCKSGLIITPSPVITGITPAVGVESTGRTLTIAGSRFVAGGSVVTFPTGVTGSCTATSTSAISCTSVAVAASVQPGSASVVVTNPDGGRTTGTMTITAPPVIASISPSSGTAGTAVNVTLTGSGFQAPITLTTGAGITPSNQTVVNATTVTATFTVAVGAADGYRSVTVTNPDGGSATAPEAFYIGTPPADTVSALATFGQQGQSLVQYQRSLGAGWSARLSGAALSSPPVWQVMKANPIGDERVLAVVDDQRGLSLHVWNGQTWTGSLSAATSTGLGRPSQTVDAAFEPQSGRAIVVYATTASTTLRYRVWDGSSWSAEALVEDLINGQPTSGRPLWVRLEPRPTTNDVVLVYGDQNDAIGSMVWRGDHNQGQWEDAVLLTTAAASHDAPISDVAFERGTGRAMVVWAAGAETTPHYRVWSRDTSDVGGWQAEGVAPSIRTTPGEPTATIRALRAVGDASNSNATVTNRIVLAASSGTAVPALEALAWNGTQWSAAQVLTATLRAHDGARGFDLVSHGANGNVLAVYATTASPNSVSRTYTVATGTWSPGETNVSLPASPSPAASVPAWTELASSRGVNDVALTQFDSLGRVVLARWSGAAWSAAVEAQSSGSGLVSVFDPTLGRSVDVPGKGTAVTLVTLNQSLTGPGIAINPPTVISDPIPPGSPTLAAGTPTINAVALSWTAVASDGASTGGSVASYELQQTLGSIVTTQLVPAVQAPGGTENYSVTGLSGAHTYLFSVRAVDAAGNRSTWSNLVSVTTPSAPPPAVTGLEAPTDSIYRTAVTLVWPRPTFGNDNAALASYIVKYKTGGAFASDAEFDATATGTTSIGESATITGLQFGVSYWFAVKVVDVLGTAGSMSNNVQVTTADHAPDPITDLRVIAIPTTSSVTLRWTMPADDSGPIASYIVKYTSVATIGTILSDAEFDSPQVLTFSGQPTRDNTVAPPVETVTVTGLTPDTQYWFAVKAVDASSLSQQSPISGSPSATTATGNVNPLDTTAPAAIADLAVVAASTTSTSITFAWTATGDDGTSGTATEYDVRYATFPLTSQNFSQGIQLPSSAPALAGQAETTTLVGLSSNTQYFAVVKAVDEAGNASFSNLAIGQSGLRRGYTLVSIPKVLTTGSDTVSAVFGDDVGSGVTVYRWRSMGTDVDTGCYDGYPSPFAYDAAYTCSQVTTVGTGLGYYVYNPSESTNGRAVLDAAGTSVTAPTVDIALSLGFNMVGNPYEREIALSAVSVKRGAAGTPVSYEQAVSNGWVGPSLLLFDGVVSRPHGVSDPAAVFKPWNGGWIQSFVNDAVLVFTSP